MTSFPTKEPPKAQKKPVTDTRHGISRTDDYAWLRADNWQEVFQDPSVLDSEIRAHLEAENRYQQEMMADTGELQEALLREMRGRIKEDDSSIPLKDGPWAYGTSFVTGGEHPRLVRTPRDGGEETILIDGDKEADGEAYFQLGSSSHSPDHSRMIWGYDDKGSEYYNLRIRDLSTLEDAEDVLKNTGGGGVWSADGNGFFYSLLDDNHRPSKLFYHRLGDDQAQDRLVFEETNPGYFMGVGGSRRDDWIMISIHDHETSEYRIIPADDPASEPKLVAERETGLQYDLEPGGDEFFILTNADGAKDFKIVTVPCNDPGRENWKELVPHKPGRLILSALAFENYLVRLEREGGLPRIVVRDRTSGEEHDIAFDEEAYSLGLGGTLEYDTDVMRFSYSSMTTPSQLFEYNMRTRERTLLKTQEVPSGHDPANYVTRRLMAKSHDGELVPISLLHRKDMPIDGTAPCLLYGYGAYGISIPAAFSTNCLSLVDRGFVYAIAHIRGGKDKGYAWYEDGKREKKLNTFKDFIAVAEHLIQKKYTQADRLVVQGGSAGGMLMGAINNMAPELFSGVIAEVAFVDVLNTMLDDTLPLTPPEWPEWGNPIASKEDYETIAAYSPYDQVSAKDYPTILAVAGLTDPRVTYWEPAKWVAKLRELKTNGNPVLFKINMDAGHGGSSGRFSRLAEIAFNYAFALKVAGKTGAVS